ncbi:FxDxF family PEP-CTERM protein [Pseudoduganella sp. SL102]|uniref:FxDxF family PEP-CTERM protein n=1 Tax=Pseudoduganella sp. SL102 TaxID=2995154 RepID=UPI00248B8FD1|nr:FxDxF family PEP-CTERM protein [Pseudoduganella sp. SL102]WBS04368.1 FxDxF family PEP-CTERM protein [Pseudoduganella sp. SL102]
MKITKFLRTAVAASALFIGIAQTANAEITTHTGNTTGGPTLDLTPWAFPGSAIPYTQYAFTVDTAGEYTFQVTAEYDAAILLFENSFDPADTTANFVNGSDDNVSSTTAAFAADLETGSTYFFIVTGSDDPEYGFYSATIGGPGLISAVPEPSTWLMLGVGLAAVGYTARRKTQH